MERDLVLIRSNTFLARQIRRMTNSDYEHIAIFIEDDKVIEATWSGVVISNIEKYTKRTNTEFEIYRLRKTLSFQEWNKVKEYLLEQVGRKYDVMQFLSLFIFFLFNINRKIKPIDIENRFLCSELIGKAFAKINIIFNKDIELDNLTPKDIENSNVVELIETI